MSEDRTLIFTATFLGIFVLFLYMIPNVLFQFSTEIPDIEGKEIDVPDKWDTSSIGAGAILFDDDDSILYNSFVDLMLNTEELRVYWPYGVPFLDYSIGIRHLHSFWIFNYYVDCGEPLTYDFINSILDDGVASVTMRCNDGDLQFLFQISYDDMSYASFQDAWDSGDIMIWVGIRDTDLTEAHFSVWVLVGNLLTFQTPEIHPLINALIAVPLWIGIVVSLLYIFDKLNPFA